MTHTLSKVKNDNPQAYTYRGLDVTVTRTYNFNGEYVVSSFYLCPELKVGSHNRYDFKTKINRRLEWMQK